MAEPDRTSRRDLVRWRQSWDKHSLLHPGNLFMVQQRESLFLRMLAEYGPLELSSRRILEVGCGDGWWLRRLLEYGAQPQNLTGVELVPELVEKARLINPGISVGAGDASRLDFEDGSFDMALQSTLFSSLLDPVTRRKAASEMLRTIKPGGMIIWYDLRIDNPNNPGVTGITRREIETLFPDCRFRFRRTTLAPPLARMLAPASALLCHLLSNLPLLLTHYLALITKPR